MSESSKETKNDIELHRGTLAIRGRVLVVGNQVHQVPNISTIAVSDLSYDRSIPQEAWWCLAAGVLFLFAAPNEWKWLPILFLAGTGLFLWAHHKNRRVDSYALSILMNAGNRTLLFSNDDEFLKRVALELCSAISTPSERSLTINLDRRQIFDNIRNSTVSVGNVSGDIVNNV